MKAPRKRQAAAVAVTRDDTSWILALAAAMLATLLGAMPAGAATAITANDVCESGADPCNVLQTYDIPNGLCSDNPIATCSVNADCGATAFCRLGAVVLDFGTRDVVVSGAGQFNFGSSSGYILAGDFTANTNNPAIDANSGGDSGQVRIFSRRKCSVGGVGAFPCLGNSDCQLGNCNARRCSAGTTRVCTSDASCQVGPCDNKGVCSGEKARQCATNADCSLGTCPAQLTCANRGTDPVNCATNSDCSFGTCSVGTASIQMGGSIIGNSEFPAFIDLRAADNVTVTKSINLAGSTPDSDGGELSADATFGSVTIAGKVIATSGGLSTGGDVSLYAGTDVILNEELELTGGDYDGGTIDFDAGRDVIINRSINGNSVAGAGYGGAFLIVAGRDLTISGVSAANKTTIEANGNANLFNEAGDGGEHDYTSERHLTLNPNTRLLANAAAPDALGGDVSLDAGGNLSFNGDVTAKALGANGSGGSLAAYASGTLTVGLGGTIDLTGGSGDAGELDMYSTGDVTFGGLGDFGASNGGSAGTVSVQSDANASISGTLRISSGDFGSMTVKACRVTLTSSGKLDASLTDSDNKIEANESIRLNTGSLMKAGAGGSNVLEYRTALKPPVVNGTVSPAATLVVDPNLAGCPVCGNNELDGGETCEDGNTTNGDGCNSNCQNEKCVQQTAAKVACTNNGDCTGGKTCDGSFCTPWDLCEDANACTTDSCNTALNGGTCVHTPKNCGDVLACTVDTCNPANGQCVHTPNNAACADNNPCTDETCSAMTGCVTTPNTNPCDDDNICTDPDECSATQCVGTPIEGCGFCGDNEVTGDEVCDDGDAVFEPGQYCGANCAVLIPCGKPTGTAGEPRTSDAQYALRVAVGQSTCSRRVCDVDNSTMIVSSDAQRILRKAVGQNVVLNCPTTGN